MDTVLEAASRAWRDEFIGVIEIDADSGLTMSGSTSELETVLSELVENAVKFSPKGGDIVLSAKSADSSTVIEVSDTGVGIPAAEIDRVFDRFFRASNARDMEARGAGLGLAIARAIARKHGGEITVTSVPGDGTRVRVIMPTAHAGHDERQGGDHDGQSPRGR